eukprot:CCRYP_017076-RA/>CCRYP_017076-RA protein AED:0.06 eAED:-0.02 QI:0/-1/0/1/-1/0/1/0/90
MGHPQYPTLMQMDNSTAEGIINTKVQQKCTKANETRFHRLHNPSCNQKEFRFYWHPITLNYADYWKKHHPLLIITTQEMSSSPHFCTDQN